MKRIVYISALFCFIHAPVFLKAESKTISTSHNRKVFKIENGLVQIIYNNKKHTFTAKRGDLAFITEGTLPGLPETGSTTVEIVNASNLHGHGKAIRVQADNGNISSLELYNSLPMLFINYSIQNKTEAPVTINKITIMSARVNAGSPPLKLNEFGPEGLYNIKEKEKRENFCFAAAANSKTRSGIVCGWISHFRGSGIVTISRINNSLSFTGRCEYGRLLISPGAEAKGETLAIGYFEDALNGLETYAKACAIANGITLRSKVPSGYCTWYHARASNQKQIAELADFCGSNLKKFGFDFIQIDDGWQLKRRDFTTFNPRGNYSKGMKPTAEKIMSNGFVAGLWYIPFGWDPKCNSLSGHPDWFVKRTDGSIYTVRWAGSCLDMTNPGARSFLEKVIAQVSREWNYKYIKIDGLWTGMAVKILYPSPAYRPDNLGDAVFHNPNVTNVEAYRSGLKLVRKAAGDDVFILGCNIAQNTRTLGASFGLVDGMRIGHDIGARWGSIMSCALPAAHFYFFHNKVWFNDPDCLLVRKPLTVDQARAWGSLIAVSGQMNVVSEWLPGLPAEKLDVVKRTMPNHCGLGRPIDLFEKNRPEIWYYRKNICGEQFNIVGLFNWDKNKPSKIHLDLSKLGLPASKDDYYHGFDFWENKFIHAFSGGKNFSLRPSSCKVLALHACLKHPQLVSTSRHVTQGAVDLVDLNWDKKENTLKGKSKIVGGDPYELRIFASGPSGKIFKVTQAETDAVAGAKAEAETYMGAKAGIPDKDHKTGLTIKTNQTGAEVRILIQSNKSREIKWKINFE